MLETMYIILTLGGPIGNYLKSYFYNQFIVSIIYFNLTLDLRMWYRSDQVRIVNLDPNFFLMRARTSLKF